MSENINISFIPKKPLARKEVLRKKPIFGISFVVSITVALVSIGFATSGYFALKEVEQEKEVIMQNLDNYIAQLKEEKGVDKKTLLEKIDNEREFVQRTKIVKTILENHVAPSKIFSYLEETTPTKVSYQNFSYTKMDEKVIISMRGSVGSYGLLASLSKWYKEQSDIITELSFGGFSPNQEGGVTFDFKGVLYPQLISYTEKIDESALYNDVNKDTEDYISDNIKEEKSISNFIEGTPDNSSPSGQDENQPDEQIEDQSDELLDT